MGLWKVSPIPISTIHKYLGTIGVDHMENTKAKSQKWAITLFTIGVFMAGLDNGIISTALTTINDSFGVSPAWGAWSITLYTLGIAISVPIIGKLSDRFGRRRLFIIEIAIFGVGSLLVALSPNFIFLLAARFIQSIGGGGIFIIGSSHILATLPKDKQGKALGLLGGMHGISAVIGLNLGAVILSLTGSWHWMFLINIPIANFLVIFGYLKIEETKLGTAKPFDFLGTLLLTFGILALMYGITNLNSQALFESIVDITVSPFLVIGLLLFVLFVLHERRVEKRDGDPIIKFSLLKNRLFQLTPMALASGIGAGLGGYLTDKQGAIKTVIYAGVIGVIGFFFFPFWVDGLGTFMIASVLAGIGLGILLGAPLNVLVGESAAHNEEGSALGTLSLIRQMGLSLFPTLYAGYIAGAFTNIAPVMKDKYGDLGLENVSGEENYGAVIDQLHQISDPDMRAAALHTE